LDGMLRRGEISVDQYTGAMAELEEQFANADVESNTFTQAIDDIANSMADAIVSGENMGDALRGVFQQIARDLISSGIRSLLQNTFSFGGSKGGGFFGSLFGGLFGGFRAEGGPVSSGNAYVVGEEGPELFMPQSSGQIIPNGATGGRSEVTVRLAVPKGVTVEETRQIAGDVAVTVVGEYDQDQKERARRT
jgi:phage-related minor tail protein